MVLRANETLSSCSQENHKQAVVFMKIIIILGPAVTKFLSYTAAKAISCARVVTKAI